MSERSPQGWRRRWMRWSVGISSGALVIAGAVGYGPGASGAGAATAPGVGSSYAQSLQVTPHEGSLAVGAVLGEALAGHTNSVARAQSQGVDLGAIGASLAGYNCGTAPSDTQVALVPQPLQAETPDGGNGVADKTEDPTYGLDKLGPASFPPTFGSTEHVLANGTPYGEADTYYGLIGGNGFSVSGMTSKAWSGLVDGNRVAAATSDIGAIDLAGQVVIKSLHWEVSYPTGGSGKPDGKFTIGSMAIGGQNVPSNDPSAAIAAANKALSGLGIELEAPVANEVQGLESVPPLEIRWVANATRDGITKQVSNPLQQNLHPIEDGLENGFPGEPAQLAAATCQSDTPITVADITIAAFTGGGYFNTALGGVNATSGDTPVNPFELSPFSPSSLAGTNQTLPGTAAVPGTAGTAGDLAGTGGTAGDLGTGGGTTGSAGGGSSSSQPFVPAAAVSHASGPLLAIGLGGLGLLALLAEGDRRMMRRAHARHAFDSEE
jgi:hypothetical protein